MNKYEIRGLNVMLGAIWTYSKDMVLEIEGGDDKIYLIDEKRISNFPTTDIAQVIGRWNGENNVVIDNLDARMKFDSKREILKREVEWYDDLWARVNLKGKEDEVNDLLIGCMNALEEAIKLGRKYIIAEIDKNLIYAIEEIASEKGFYTYIIQGNETDVYGEYIEKCPNGMELLKFGLKKH